MAADILSSDFKTRLNLKTKTVGADKIRRAKENNEDIAILSMFLPFASAEEENRRFRCSLGDECFLGDYKKATPGNDFLSSTLIKSQNICINFHAIWNLDNDDIILTLIGCGLLLLSHLLMLALSLSRSMDRHLLFPFRKVIKRPKPYEM